MERRAFVGGSLAALATLSIGDVVRAQTRIVREEWTATGAPTGHEPADPESLTDQERSHVPVLTLPRHVHPGRPFDLVVQIGLHPHEMSGAHHIDWIEVCLDERRVAVVDLTSEVPYPIVRIPIVLHAPATLVARALQPARRLDDAARSLDRLISREAGLGGCRWLAYTRPGMVR